MRKAKTSIPVMYRGEMGSLGAYHTKGTGLRETQNGRAKKKEITGGGGQKKGLLF